MKLLGSLTSPYVRKARIVLAEKKIDYDFILDSPWEPESEVPNYNPLGKVPVLVLDDDLSLFDSRVISEYVDSMSPNNKLLPASGRERMLVKRWEALADGIMDASALAFLEGKRTSAERSEAWIKRQRDKIARSLSMMSEELDDAGWCHGNGISLADIATGCALGYLDLRLSDIDWRAAHPNLARLQEKLNQRTSFEETTPPKN